MDDDVSALSMSGNPEIADEIDIKDEAIDMDMADNHESSSMALHSVAGDVEDDDVRYEPIAEPFYFKDQLIYPCYVILPYVTKKQIKTLGKAPKEVGQTLIVTIVPCVSDSQVITHN